MMIIDDDDADYDTAYNNYDSNDRDDDDNRFD